MVVSAGRFITAQPAPSRVPQRSVDLHGRRWTYAELYRRQPAVRTVVSFLARNVAQLRLHTFELTGDDRRRVRDGRVANLIAQPNPVMTQYRWLYRMMSDLAIYDEHYSVHVESNGQDMLLPVPVAKVTPVGDSWASPDSYDVFRFNIPATDMLRIVGYHPDSLWSGVSPLESLRQVLAGDQAAEEERESFWRNGAKLSGILSRPVGVAWSDEAKKRFRAQWEARYGPTGSSAGGTPLLEDGMTYEQVGATAKDAQYLESRKLTREEVAAVYHIAPPMVGILDNANYSNVKQFHSQLYQDTLGPSLQQIEQEVDMFVARLESGRFVEFNVMEKLRGTFEEQAQIMSTAVGGPWMTRNEARARLNLPRIDEAEADELITPLNVTAGGLASPRDTAPKALGRKAVSPIVTNFHDGHIAPIRAAMRSNFERQLRRLRAQKGFTFDRDRWDPEMADDLERSSMTVAAVVASDVARSTGTELSPEVMRGWLRKKAEAMADVINSETEALLAAIDGMDRDQLEAVFGAPRNQTAVFMAKAVVGFAFLDSATHASAEFADKGTKTWVVTSSRSRHPHLGGVTIPIDGVFSNGARWPGDSSAGANEAAGCKCQLIINPGG